MPWRHAKNPWRKTGRFEIFQERTNWYIKWTLWGLRPALITTYTEASWCSPLAKSARDEPYRNLRGSVNESASQNLTTWPKVNSNTTTSTNAEIIEVSRRKIPKEDVSKLDDRIYSLTRISQSTAIFRGTGWPQSLLLKARKGFF